MRPLRIAVAIAVLLLGILPVAAWIPGGASDPAYVRRWIEWGYGGAICIGTAIVFAIASRSFPAAARTALAAPFTRIRSAAERFPIAFDAAVGLVCFLVYAAAARSVLSARPLLIDEIVQVLQARMYAGGHLSIPADSAKAFFSVLHVVDIGDRVYSQFPPGWPAVLAVASLANVEWLAGPVIGGCAVFLFARILRRVHPDSAGLVVVGTLLFGLAPFVAFQSASHMSHVPALACMLLAVLCLHRALVDPVGHETAWTAMLAGVSAGASFAMRPLDAVAFIVPAALWTLWRARQEPVRRRAAIMVVVGAAMPFLIVLWVNSNTTGNPLEFGYSALWGPAHGLGFHSAPWGDAHTPARGLELLSLYVTRLNVYLYESPFPSLLPALLGLALAPRLTTIERFLLVATGMHALLYFAYWHDGFYLGPRFVVPWVPLITLLGLRCGDAASAQRRSTGMRSAFAGTVIASLVLTIMIAVPSRVAQYRGGLTSMRADYSDEAKHAGVTNALVFVRESWGARLVARLWELGISRPAAAALYSKVDACMLDHGIVSVESSDKRGTDAEAALTHLLSDSLRVRASDVSPDTTERMLPGSRYDEQCSAQVAADQAGYALFPPFLLDRESGNFYARDLGARDSLLLKRFPLRRAYLVSREGVDGAAPLVWRPMAALR